MTLLRVTLAALLLTADLPAAAQEVSYYLANGSGLTVAEFYSSPADYGISVSDLLRASVLELGGAVNVTIDGSQCNHDVRMILKDGQELMRTGEMCEQAGLTLES